MKEAAQAANSYPALLTRSMKGKSRKQMLLLGIHRHKLSLAGTASHKRKWQTAFGRWRQDSYLTERIRATISPYNPNTSAKMRMRIMPTNSLGCWAVPLTPASPTTPMAKPAARPLSPTLRPAPRCKKLLQHTMHLTINTGFGDEVYDSIRYMYTLTEVRVLNQEWLFAFQMGIEMF